MDIEVKLFASFRKNRWNCKHLVIEKDTKIENILDFLQIKEEDLGMVLVNGKYSKIDTVLSDGDILAIFPPIAGG